MEAKKLRCFLRGVHVRFCFAAPKPMSRAEVIEKARDLTTPVLGPEKAERLIETVYAIENG